MSQSSFNFGYDIVHQGWGEWQSLSPASSVTQQQVPSGQAGGVTHQQVPSGQAGGFHTNQQYLPQQPMVKMICLQYIKYLETLVIIISRRPSCFVCSFCVCVCACGNFVCLIQSQKAYIDEQVARAREEQRHRELELQKQRMRAINVAQATPLSSIDSLIGLEGMSPSTRKRAATQHRPPPTTVSAQQPSLNKPRAWTMDTSNFEGTKKRVFGLAIVPYCYYCRRVLILANFSDFVIIAKFCPR